MQADIECYCGRVAEYSGIRVDENGADVYLYICIEGHQTIIRSDEVKVKDEHS